VRRRGRRTRCHHRWSRTRHRRRPGLQAGSGLLRRREGDAREGRRTLRYPQRHRGARRRSLRREVRARPRRGQTSARASSALLLQPPARPLGRRHRLGPGRRAAAPVPVCAADAERVAVGAEPAVRKGVTGDGRTRRAYWEAGPAYAEYNRGYFNSYAGSGLLPGVLMGAMMFGGMGGGWDGAYGGDMGGGDMGGDGGDGGGLFGGDGG